MVRVLSLYIIDCTFNNRCNSLFVAAVVCKYFHSSLSHGPTAGFS